ncbi:Uncharacterized protein TCM_029378 [Theobroma cacao]|uniref:Uncharacterized protein n=1 Tax=Theobroma cacao TaxID=3641 RepID=A0A061GEG3_THECC|nr:Uncharacterized protein TCM_029378 [Theobroma cacao]
MQDKVLLRLPFGFNLNPLYGADIERTEFLSHFFGFYVVLIVLFVFSGCVGMFIGFFSLLARIVVSSPVLIQMLPEG